MSNILSQIGSAVKGKVDGVQANVDAEASAREAAIAAEASARGTADTTLQANIDAEATTARAAESANATAISTEESARITADATLTTNLNQEVTDRQAAVSDEATARSTADATLQANIDAEATTARAAEATLTTNLNQEVLDRESAVSSEATLRANADAALESSKASLSGAAFTGAVTGTDLTLSGNLTVQGTTTSLETVNSQVKDSLMLLNDGAAASTANASDLGLIMERGSQDDGNVAIVFDEGIDKFAFYKTSAAATSTDISGDDVNAALVDIKVNDVFIGADNLGSLAEFTAALNAQ